MLFYRLSLGPAFLRVFHQNISAIPFFITSPLNRSLLDCTTLTSVSGLYTFS